MKVGIIGFGNMGSSIYNILKKRGHKIYVAEKNVEKIKKLKNDKKEKYYEIEENNFDSLINEEILNIKKFLSSKGFSYKTIYSILKLIKI